MDEKNAVQSAKAYLFATAFSRKGLIKLLESDGYSRKAATVAVDSLSVNWNEQAQRSAESYLSICAFSRNKLIQQLVFEGFDTSQAEYAANTVGHELQ